MGANISHRNRFNVHVNDSVRQEKRTEEGKRKIKTYEVRERERERENAKYKAQSIE